MPGPIILDAVARQFSLDTACNNVELLQYL